MANPFVDKDPGELCIKVGDREPSWLFRLRRGDANKTPVDVSGLATTEIKINITNKETKVSVTVDITANLDDGSLANRGLVRYDPKTADVGTQGIFLVDLYTIRPVDIQASFPTQGFFIVNIAKRAA